MSLTHMCLILGSCSNVQEKLNGLKEAVEALCEGTSVSIPTVRNTWTSVPITIASEVLTYDTLTLSLSSSHCKCHLINCKECAHLCLRRLWTC